MPYDVIKDFTPITMVGAAPLLLVTHDAAPFKNLKELIAYAKTRPANELTFSTSGSGSAGHLAGALLGGHTWTWVPYLLLWLGLLTGGVIGTLLFHFFGLQSIWFAVLWAGSITVVTASLRHRIGV